ncbi:hypothetical protein [Nitrospira sp. M1]
MPDPFDTQEEWLRFHHDDLAEMTTTQLREEKERIKIRMLYGTKAPSWFSGRLEAIEREMNARNLKK